MRKQHYLTISQRDSDAFHLLLNCNCCLHSHLLNFASENRIRSYLKEKLIERVDMVTGITQSTWAKTRRMMIKRHLNPMAYTFTPQPS